MTTLHLEKSIGRSLSWRCGFLLIPLALACFALPPAARAFLPPPDPDGGYLNLNTAEGNNALYSLTTGADNTAIGFGALFRNTTGGANTANGWEALAANTTGNNNTATGFGALSSNTTINGVAGGANTANGWEALFRNTIGQDNIAVGDSALFSNTTGGGNVSTGDSALGHNTTGNQNTATGILALLNNTTGSGNIAVGASAGKHLTTGSNNIDIGAFGAAGESDTIRIGKGGLQTKAFIQGIHGVAVTGSTVVVNANGQLGVLPSSQRFKDEIKPMDKASEAILALKPVTFRYKQDIDSKGTPQFGLVAEDVEKVSPHLVVRDAEGKVYSVRYEAVNAMLLNEFLKEHRAFLKQQRKVEVQEKTIAELKSGMTAFAATMKEQAAQIQKVSAQLELSKAVPQTVAENQ